MEGSFSEHFGPAELAQLAKALEDARSHPDTSLNPADIHPHFAACATCREHFEELKSLDRQMMTLRPAESAIRQGDCPEAEVWLEIASGVNPHENTLLQVEHASRCDHCGPLLRAAIAEFSELSAEISEEERTQIAALESSSESWQQALARRIIDARGAANDRGSDRRLKPWWENWFTVPRLAMAGASLLVLVGFGSWVVASHQNQSDTAKELLAKAYTEKRPIALRIAGAAYAPVNVTRGGDGSFTNRPTSLLKAEALIASQLASHPSDPGWLQAQAQADMLEGKYDAAVEALRRALELQPHSAPLLIDLGTAYFQQAQQGESKENLGTAYESLSQALRVIPDDPVVLFNRAIVAEQQFLYRQALEDWDHYLRIDATSKWAEEARIRASAVREKVTKHESVAKPLLSVEEIAGRVKEAGLGPEIDERVEEYLQEAVGVWLPQAFPERGSGGDPQSARALFFLADVTSRQHGDRWLADLLDASSSSKGHFPEAVSALARAVNSNQSGDYDSSRQQAILAERLFRLSGISAGALRAEFERAFADQLSRHTADCMRLSRAAKLESMRHSYPWVQIQLGLEDSVCSALMSNLGAYERIASDAQKRAGQAGYGGLYLRATIFEADGKFNAGDRAGGWNLVYEGLERYWQTQVPAMRGYNLYIGAAYEAEKVGQPDMQLAEWRESAALMDTDPDLLLRAAPHSHIAQAAMATHQPEVAEREYQIAARDYALAPQTEATQGLRLENEIKSAQLEAGQSALDAALARLTRIQDQIQGRADNNLGLLFYSTLGEVQLRSYRAPEAEQSYRAALRFSERSLASLTLEESRTSWSKSAAPVYLGLAESELMQGREREALDVYEWYLSAPQRAGERDHGGSQNGAEGYLSGGSARRPLSANQTVIAYGLLPDGLAIWVDDDRGVTAKWLPKSPQELQDVAADFAGQCSDPTSELSALRRDARLLYAALIAPVEDRLTQGRTLVIEAEGPLARVPFEALLDGNDHYLIERASVVHSLGRYSQARLHDEVAISASLPILAVGSAASSPADGLISLPDVAAEADAVAVDFRSAQVLKGGEATLSALESDFPGIAVFHFAGHALDAPLRRGLLLESKEANADSPPLMDANVVRSLRLENLQLAVLSACSTASGSGQASGFDSVTDAFLRAGVPHVVASRWTVDSAGTREFVQNFYRSALSGESVSEAVRQTSRRMLADPRTSHPYYWSAFAAYGRS